MTGQPRQWDVHQEFAIVVELLASTSRSMGVDAFALSLLKAERHARRIFTFLVFQNSVYTEDDIATLRATLVKCGSFYFQSAIAGIDLISPWPLDELCGEHHSSLLASLPLITKRRNKIFHGQLTDESLARDDLMDMTLILKNWCVSLAVSGENKLGYDGFLSQSFVKNLNSKFYCSLKRQLTSVADYSELIKNATDAGKPLIKQQ